MVASIFVAFKSLNIEPEKAQKMAQLFIKTYSATLAKGKAIRIDPRTAKVIVCNFLKAADKKVQRWIISSYRIQICDFRQPA